MLWVLIKKSPLQGVLLMSTNNIGFMKKRNKQNYPLIIIKYNQICTLILLLGVLIRYDTLTSISIFCFILRLFSLLVLALLICVSIPCNTASQPEHLEYICCIMRKPDFCICQNNGADQLCGNRAAYQHLCFRYIDSIIPPLPKS